MLGRIIDKVRSWFVRPEQVSANERRGLTRLTLHIPVFCKCEKVLFKADAMDVSVGGLRLSTNSRTPFQVGQSISVARGSYEDADRVMCRVQWVQAVDRKVLLGLKYSDTPARMRASWVKHQLREMGLSPYSFRERRRTRRYKVTVPIALLDPRAPTPDTPPLLEVGAGDLSEGGAAVRSIMRLPVGTEVVCRFGPARGLPSLEVPGKVLAIREESGGAHILHRLIFQEPTGEQKQLIRQYQQQG